MRRGGAWPRPLRAPDTPGYGTPVVRPTRPASTATGGDASESGDWEGTRENDETSEFAKEVDTVAERAKTTPPPTEKREPDPSVPEAKPSPGAYRMRRPAAVDDVYTPSPDVSGRERATPLRVRLGPPRKS